MDDRERWNAREAFRVNIGVGDRPPAGAQARCRHPTTPWVPVAIGLLTRGHSHPAHRGPTGSHRGGQESRHKLRR